MKKENIRIKFYTVQWSKNTIDRALPINDKGQYIPLADALPTDFNYEVPFYVDGSTDRNNGANHKLTKSIEFETQDSIRIDIATPNLPHFNYAVVECLTDEIFHLRKSYFFVRKSDSYSAKFTKLTLEMDFFASFGAQYLEGIEGKQVDYAKRHIDRWVPNTDPISKDTTELFIRDYKKSAASAVNLDFPSYGKDDIDSTATIYDWIYKEFGNKTEALVGTIKTYKTSGNSYSRTFNKRFKLSKNAKGESVLTSDDDGSTLTFYFKLVVVEVNTLVLESDLAYNNVETVYLPKVVNNKWDKAKITEWVDREYGKGRRWTFKTDIDAYLADNNNFNQITSDVLKSYQGDIANSIFGNLYLVDLQNKSSLKILTQGELVYKYGRDVGIKDLDTVSISFHMTAYSNSTNTKFIHKARACGGGAGDVIADNQVLTYEDCVTAFGWGNNQLNTKWTELTKRAYAEVKVYQLEFINPIEINIFTPGLSDYEKIADIRKAITSPLLGTTTQTASSVNYSLTLDKSKLPSYVKDVTLLSQTNDNFAGIKKLKLQIEYKDKDFIMNTDKTSEIWTNNEYQDITEVNGATDHYTPLKMLDMGDLENSDSRRVQAHINNLPYKNEFGMKQRVFYGLASKMCNNKFTKITDNEFYAYAVLPSQELDEVRSNFSSSGVDLTKTHSIETPFVFIPILNAQIDRGLKYDSTSNEATTASAGDVFDLNIMRSDFKVVDELSGYSLLPYSKLKLYFQTYNANNNVRTLKEVFADRITKLILSPIPLIQRTPIKDSILEGEVEQLYNTYFTKIETTVNNKKYHFAAIKVDYKQPTDWIEIDIDKLGGIKTTLPDKLPKKISDDDYLNSGVETALLNSKYEKHNITQLLSKNPIALGSRSLHANNKIIISPKITGSGVAHDIKIKDSNEKPAFVLHDFSLPFGVKESQKVLQQQAASAQANLDNIRRQTEATERSTLASAALGGLGTLFGSIAGGGAGALVASSAVQGLSGSIQARIQEGYNDAAQRAQINAAIADAGRRPSPSQELILPESNLNSPFISSVQLTNSSGYNLKPFNHVVTKPNSKLALKVAKAFNDNGYASNTSEPFSNTNLKSRYYWNFIQLANVDEISQDLYLPQLAKDTISAILANGVRIHWFRKSPTIDRSLHNHETHLIKHVK